MAYKDREKMIAYNNQYNAGKYDRVTLMLPIGDKAIIKAHADKRRESINAFLKRAISETMQRDNQTGGNLNGGVTND